MAKRTLNTSTVVSPSFDAARIDDGMVAQAKLHYTAYFDDEPVTSLSDAEVWAAIVGVKNTSPHLSGNELLDAIADAMDAAETDVDTETDAKPIDILKLPSWIKSAASKLNKDKEAIGQFQAIMDAEDTRKRGPIVLMLRCLSDFAKTQTLPSGRVEYTECEMDEWPVPLSYCERDGEMKEMCMAGAEYCIGRGANKRTAKNASNSGLAMDLYRRDGENASRYMDLTLSLDIGKKLSIERENYRLGSLENPSGPYVAMGRIMCKEEYELRVSRLKLIAQQLRIVKNTWDQYRILQSMDTVYPEFITRDGDKWVDENDHSKGKVQVLTGTQKPLAVVNKAKPSVSHPFGYSSFNALKLDVAKAKGGSYEDVVTSGKKPKEKNKGGGKDTGAGTTNAPAGGSTVNWQINDFRAAMIGEQNFVDNPSNAISARQAFRASPEHSDELLVAAGRVFLFLHNTLGDNELCTRLDVLFKERPGTFKEIIEGNVVSKNSASVGKAA